MRKPIAVTLLSIPLTNDTLTSERAVVTGKCRRTEAGSE
jgi:hypothetical protein